MCCRWHGRHARREGFRRVDPALPTSFAEQATLALQVARGREDRQRLNLFEDRDRIGRDLHDLVIQRLFAVGLGLQSTANLSADPELRTRMERAIDDLDGTIKDIRRTIFALGAMGADAADVQSEVERLVERAGATMKLRPTLRFDGPLRTGISAVIAPDLLAVLSEALTNVSRHAQASAVDVLVRVDATDVLLVVTDDGIGMRDGAVESGLGNMRARARKHGGTLTLESGPGTGTKLSLDRCDRVDCGRVAP